MSYLFLSCTEKLITWPVVKITDQGVQSMEGIEHLVDVIITTFE
jgi:hypothetical protein